MLTFISMAVNTENADFQKKKNPFAIDFELLEFNLPGESLFFAKVPESSLSSMWVRLFCASSGQ